MTPGRRAAAGSRGPRVRLGSTYRLQLNGLGFRAAAGIVGYLASLGVETLYVSPVLAAVPGSTHGYDVVDPTRLDPSLGDRDDLEVLLAELDAHHMRLLVDIVPNHMGASEHNPWWWDVLRHGRASAFAPYFDIDWSAHGGRVLLPVLGRPLEDVLAAGELSVVGGEDGAPVLAYFDRRFPLDPATEPGPPGPSTGRAAPALPAGDPGALAALVDRQHYRLAFWRLSRREGSYRRFFDVDALVGVSVERPEVYRATHRLLLELVADRRVAGFRADHVDGLADPPGYLSRLRADLDRTRDDHPALVVEKILARAEALPAHWPVDGTTGYELADLAGGLLVDPAGATRIARAAAADVAAGTPGGAPGAEGFGALAVSAKREVTALLFPGQLAQVARLAAEAIGRGARGADLAGADAAAAVAELTAQLDVYRTYFDTAAPAAGEGERLRRAARAAGAALGGEGRRALEHVVALVEGSLGVAAPEAVRRWQQLTSAVAAKGVEDTALYRFDGLLAGAEVGQDPGTPAVDVVAFHRAMAARTRWPGSLSATATHDSKRGEDVRARLAVLSELPDRWSALSRRWLRRYGGLAAVRGGAPAPDRHDQLFALQTVVGAWPLDGPSRRFTRRVADYAVKAAREAKRRTSWLDPDERYERALRAYVRHLLADRRFVADVEALIADVGPAGAASSLGLVALKMTVPGVPDLYQGTERWAFTLVDPDNRAPVDFARHERQLASLDAFDPPGEAGDPAGAARLLAQWRDGQVKLLVVRQLLHLRRRQSRLFADGSYLPLEVRGPGRRHVVAFARRHRRAWAITVVPRLVFGLAGPATMPVGADLWRGTAVALPDGAPVSFVDACAGGSVAARRGRLAVGSVLATLPVAVLVPA